MNDLETIIATALIGTERQPLGAMTLEPNLTGETREITLLNAAALVSVYHHAARVPAKTTVTLEVSGADTKTEMSDAARNILQRILNGYQELLSEFLELVKTQRFAHRDLPQMLELGRSSTTIRTSILPLLDARGRWLASLNKDWAWATGSIESTEDAIKTFELGNKAARVLALRSIRETDANSARELLETTWKQDAAAERKDFIEILRTQLSSNDEAFLENALSDRSGDVRDTATELLALIPESAFNKRLLERLKKILILKKPKSASVLERVKEILVAKQAQLEIVLPDEFEADWAKDNIEKKPPQGKGEKQFWVTQMLNKASLEMLEKATGLDAVSLLKAAHKDWKPQIENAIRSALSNNPPVELIKFMIAYDFTYAKIDGVLDKLEPSFRESLARQRCFVENNYDLTLLQACKAPWRPEFMRDAIEWLAKQVSATKTQTKQQYFYGFSDAFVKNVSLKQIKLILNGDSNLPNWTQLLTTINDPLDEKHKNVWYWENTKREVQKMLETLQLRLEMYETITRI